MKFLLKILVVLLFVIQNLTAEEFQKTAVTVSEEVKEIDNKILDTKTEQRELETSQKHTAGENSFEKARISNGNKTENANESESELIRIVLKDVLQLASDQKELAAEAVAIKNSTKYLVNVNTFSLSSLQNSNSTEQELLQIILKDDRQLTNNLVETHIIKQNATESFHAVEATTLGNELIQKPLAINLNESKLIELILDNVNPLTDTAKNLNETAHRVLAKPTYADFDSNIKLSALESATSTEAVLQKKDIGNSTLGDFDSNNKLSAFERATSSDKEVVEVVLKQKDIEIPTKKVLNFSETSNPTSTQKVTGSILEISTESLDELATTSTATVENKLTLKPLDSLQPTQSSSQADVELLPMNVKNFTFNSAEIKDTEGTSTTRFLEVENKLSLKILYSSETIQNLHLAESELALTSAKRQENSKESLIAAASTTVVAEELTAKPSICLEEYAVKQMNFILDYLLIETQEFIAKVLQDTVNSVFPRDHLKLYVEGLNNLLNPDSSSVYSSDEDVTAEELKFDTQDEIYEEIMKKLNFLKSKPSKLLEKQLPLDWISEYRRKKADLVIWLDKAIHQMHNEFNSYLNEDEDYIKYRYFNETFDDISRATEIHHKLALLADLVKTVKNKKQITFMDLYMQT